MEKKKLHVRLVKKVVAPAPVVSEDESGLDMALARAEQIIARIDSLRTNDFLSSVRDSVRAVRQTMLNRGSVTPRQQSALSNWLSAVNKFKH